MESEKQERTVKTDVLVVDDQRTNLVLMQRLLAKDKTINVVTASSGEEALEHIEAYDFALILLDVIMPGLDGFATARRVRSGPARTAGVPIIFVTATSGDLEYMFQGYDAGAVDVLFKPVEPKILMSKVRVFVELHRREKALERTSRRLSRAIDRLKLSEESLRESRERFRSIVENASEIIFTLSGNGEFTFVSPAYTTLTGRPKEEILGLEFTAYVHPDDQYKCEEFVEDLMEERNTPVSLEYRVRHTDETWRWHLATGSLVKSSQGDPQFIVGVAQDITERIKAEEELKLHRDMALAANQGMAEVNQELEEVNQRLQESQDELKQANVQLSKKQKLLDDDLRAAGAIQTSLLPHEFKPPKTVDVAWKFRPSAHVGGDLFNVLALDDHNLAIYMLDVMGHGVSAALVAMSVSQLLQTHTGFITDGHTGKIFSPGQVLGALNQEFPFSRFETPFTIFYMILDTRDGSFVYSNAGHSFPILLDKQGASRQLTKGGTIVGVTAKPFEEGLERFESGDSLFLYTDGVVEYRTETGELYGMEQFVRCLVRSAGRPLTERLEEVYNDMMYFGYNQPPQDDVSLLGIEYLAAG